MQRRTAIVLLLLALFATGLPLAQALTAPAPYACCIRATHHCHDSARTPGGDLALRSTSCCNHDCCRAVTTSQSAHPQSQLSVIAAQRLALQVAESRPLYPTIDLATSQSPRAPPRVTA